MIDGLPSPNHLPAKETFKLGHVCYAHLDLLKCRAASDSLYFLQYLGENKTFFSNNQLQAIAAHIVGYIKRHQATCLIILYLRPLLLNTKAR